MRRSICMLLLLQQCPWTCTNALGVSTVAGHDASFSVEHSKHGVVVLYPRNGTLVLGPTVTVAYSFPQHGLAAMEAAAVQGQSVQMCFRLDGEAASCVPARAKEAVSLRLDPAPHRALSAWLRVVVPLEDGSIAEVGRLGFAPHTSTFGVSSAATTVAADSPLYATAGQGSSTAAREALFDAIYEHRVWDYPDHSAEGGAAARSGFGSILSTTAEAREALLQVFNAYSVTSLLDGACGELGWMRYVLAAAPPSVTRYTCADVSPLIIERNVEAQAAAPTAAGAVVPTYEVLDLAAPGALTGGEPHDLVVVRQMMFHASPADNLAILANIDRSGARLAMLSTHLRHSDNGDPHLLAQGHKINLFKAPYCLRDPIAMYRDGQPDLFLALFEVDASAPLAQAVC